MARNLNPRQRKMIAHMISSKKRLTTSQMAKLAKCTERSITNIRKIMRLFGSPNPPKIPSGPPLIVTSVMLDTLCDHLAKIPGLCLEEMAKFLWDEFNILPSSSSIQRALSRVGWTKKTARQKPKEQNPQLRDFYQHKLSEFHSYHLVFVDESGCDKRVGHKRTGWSPLGVTSVQMSKFYRGQRYQILPAYTQEGILLSRIFKGAMDAVLFESFIEYYILYYSDRVKQLYSDIGVRLLYLLPYSPDFNSIEEFFAELKAYIKKAWLSFERDPD
ncbi:hypothetical protein NUU61_000872 [Penicillium alfredii]|uniref:Winged helix-turn helix domain-containing protein n=1 Tax=Penicillium alfredii TaxID=1506179 RepID=A0A9W9GAX7_9EURO|nr:uncharacterized protein NUU61_000872 [Penicillium alfredii]KAJ5115113.1 hypothetical protein NUU61_000872 [Penicillium alfredii]